MNEFKDPKNFAKTHFNFFWVFALRQEAFPLLKTLKLKFLVN